MLSAIEPLMLSVESTLTKYVTAKTPVWAGGNMGKGDTPRPVNKDRYDENYRRIFGDRTKDTDEQDSRKDA